MFAIVSPFSYLQVSYLQVDPLGGNLALFLRGRE